MAKINEGKLIAKARDKFFKENPELLVVDSLYGKYRTYATAKIYLKNRLEKAFIAGWDAARKKNA